MSIVGMMVLFGLHLSFLLVSWAITPGECVGWDCGSGLTGIVEQGTSEGLPFASDDNDEPGFFIVAWWQRITEAVGGFFDNAQSVFRVVWALATFSYPWLTSGDSRLMEAVGWVLRVGLSLIQSAFLISVVRTILGRGQ